MQCMTKASVFALSAMNCCRCRKRPSIFSSRCWRRSKSFGPVIAEDSKPRNRSRVADRRPIDAGTLGAASPAVSANIRDPKAALQGLGSGKYRDPETESWRSWRRVADFHPRQGIRGGRAVPEPVLVRAGIPSRRRWHRRHVPFGCPARAMSIRLRGSTA